MTFLPIVHRELLVRSRQAVTWRVRWAAVGLASLLALPILLGNHPNPGVMGRQLFTMLSVLALMYCLLEGARQTADCLSGEKREGTLGLLFLTDLKGYDVVLGKLAAASLNSFYSLLSILPVLGLPVLAGGVAGAELARMASVLVVSLCLALSMGMCVSSHHREEMKSLFTTLGLLLLLVAVPPLLDGLLRWRTFTPATAWCSLASPGFAWYMASDAGYRAAPRLFWASMVVLQTISVGLLVWAAIRAQRGLREGPDPPTAPATRTRRAAPGRRAARQPLLSQNPIRWLARRQPGLRPWIWAVAGFVMLGAFAQPLFYFFRGTRAPLFGWGLFAYGPLIVHFSVRIFIAYLACRFFVEARRTGTLELLLCTPLRRADLLRGQRQALRDVLLVPLLIALLAQPIAAGVTLGLNSYSLQMAILLPGRALVLFADAAALTWFGAWAALASRRPGGAVAKTFLLVTVLPWILHTALLRTLLVMIGGPGSSWVLLFNLVPLSLFTDAAFMLWSRRRLRRLFPDCAGATS
ncbi:MAG: hypothetical protein HZA90_01040 [Verrucomicrobia bacterium]|nr:hypothetical protein [Verrucomicrobiota bacterium]